MKFVGEQQSIKSRSSNENPKPMMSVFKEPIYSAGILRSQDSKSKRSSNQKANTPSVCKSFQPKSP